MHIPDGMITGIACPVTLSLGAGALALSAYAASKTQNKPSAVKFAAVASTIFILQMLNFPISSGTSGHFLGSAFSVWALGAIPGMLAMTLVVMIQAIFFGDGGLSAMGANLICMAFVGGGSASFIISRFKKVFGNMPESFGVGIAAFISMVLASLACSALLWISGNAQFKILMSAMVVTHMKIGIPEALITMAMMGLTVTISKSEMSKSFKAVTVALMLAAGAGLSALASALPDGLEYTAEKLGFLGNANAIYEGIMPDYALPGISAPLANCLISALAGLFAICLFSWLSWKAEKTFSGKY